MASIDRRDFLRSYAAGAIATPAWLADAFGIAPQGRGEQDARRAGRESRLTGLRKAYRRAVSYGKPLLVCVVPEDFVHKEQRGQQLGALLNHGGDAVLHDLALCELACATPAELQNAVPDAKVEGEPLMILVEPARAEGASATTRAIDPDLSPLGTPPRQDEADSNAAWRSAHRAHDRARNALIAASLRANLAENRGALHARDHDVRSTLAEDERARLDDFLGRRAKPDAGFLVRAAAMVRLAAETPGNERHRRRLLDSLAVAARTVIVKREIPGSRWAWNTGCGLHVEGHGSSYLLCGMGWVPPLAQRFLYFLTDR